MLQHGHIMILRKRDIDTYMVEKNHDFSKWGTVNECLENPVNTEELITATLDINRIYEERQNFDPSGHYSRPDVTQLSVNRERQSIIQFKENT